MKVDVDGVGLYFDVEGLSLQIDGPSAVEKPTLILLHGSPGNSDHTVFKGHFSDLADIAQIVYLDISGSGRSDDSLDGDYSLERWADELVEFCDAVGIHKPIVLGNSAGGMIAAMYGIRHPDHPAKLVLSSTQGRFDTERSLAVFERLGGPEARAVAHAALVEKGDLESFMAYAKVCAGEDDPVTPVEDSDDIVSRLDPAIVRYERFANAGHGVWLDRPQDAMRVLR